MKITSDATNHLGPGWAIPTKSLKCPDTHIISGPCTNSRLWSHIQGVLHGTMTFTTSSLINFAPLILDRMFRSIMQLSIDVDAAVATTCQSGTASPCVFTTSLFSRARVVFLPGDTLGALTIQAPGPQQTMREVKRGPCRGCFQLQWFPLMA